MKDLLKDYILSKKHHQYRISIPENLAKSYKKQNLHPIERMVKRFEKIMSLETPHILPNEKITFSRSVSNLPPIFTEDEWENIKSKHFIHELGYMSNLSPNYEDIISKGLLEIRKTANEYEKTVIYNIISLSDKYKLEAQKQGRDDIVKVLERVPKYGATNFREALQFFRILHFSLWLEGNYHNTVGRFDKYMYPYFKKDMEAGVYTKETALELIEDFFISFNKDSDLYVGVQQGDNGQSMVLGGIVENGNEIFNELSELCLIASKNLKMIDPKINLRVSKNTPIEVYELGSELTKVGLGFPQYSNDDVVIEGLVDLGYDLKDARDYVVAACWEFIIPKCGMDIANIGALSFPKIVDKVIHRGLGTAKDFDTFMEGINRAIKTECNNITKKIKNLWFIPSPLLNLMMDKIKYNNFGIHGTGIATASDSLAVIKKYVFDEKTVSKKTLIEAIDSNFEKHSQLLPLFRYKSPKMGTDNDYVDNISIKLLDMFSNNLKGKTNCLGGIYRAGTGSAMFYLWHANEIGASCDGRLKGEPFGTNFSPSLFAKIDGPTSIIKSFTKQNFKTAINGGPLTLEFHSSMFNNEDSIKKIAILVKTFIDLGGHQLQLNTIDKKALLDAQIHPEKYPHLVVRIWGWSAYFVELDKPYQNHVIARQEYIL